MEIKNQTYMSVIFLMFYQLKQVNIQIICFTNVQFLYYTYEEKFFKCFKYDLSSNFEYVKNLCVFNRHVSLRIFAIQCPTFLCEMNALCCYYLLQWSLLRIPATRRSCNCTASCKGRASSPTTTRSWKWVRNVYVVLLLS